MAEYPREMPDPNPSERLAEIEARVKEFYALGDTWSNLKKKKLIGEDIPWLLEREKKLREALELISKRGQRYEHNTAEIGSVADCSDIARKALADSGEAGG